ncbi:MAG TPA: nuclear transport factor 2 family protein [Acidimicrobiales bacterium]
MADEVERVLAANQAFYDAFEARDLDAMSDIWEHTDPVCTHPGWRTLRGWASVSASWYTLFTNGQQLQFIVTNAHARVEGGVAWVSCDENLLGSDGGVGGTVAALNVFHRRDDQWRLAAHHGSPVATGA